MNHHIALSDGRRTEGIMRTISLSSTKTPSRTTQAKNDVTQRKLCYMLYANNKRLSFRQQCF